MIQANEQLREKQDQLNSMKTEDGRYKCDQPECHARKPYITVGRLVPLTCSFNYQHNVLKFSSSSMSLYCYMPSHVAIIETVIGSAISHY